MELRPIIAGASQFGQSKPGLAQANNTTVEAGLSGEFTSLSIKAMVSQMLGQSVAEISHQQQLLTSLPMQVQSSARQVLLANLPEINDFSAGLVSLLNLRRNVGENLHKLADNLALAFVYRSFMPEAQLQTASSLFRQRFIELLPQLFDNTLTQDAFEHDRASIQKLIGQNLREAAAMLSKLGNQTYMDSLPPTIREAAVKLAMPEIAHLWRLAEGSSNLWLDTAVEDLAQSSQTMRSLAESVTNTFRNFAEEDSNRILLTMQIPFATSEEKILPAHIHIYHEKQKTSDSNETAADTWVRINLEPEFIGPVEAVFHLYDDDILDIKVVFDDNDVSLLFREETAAIREACKEFPFLLKELTVL